MSTAPTLHRHLPWSALLLVFTMACETPEPEVPAFRYQLPAAPTTLDPAAAGDVYSNGIIDRLFDGLMRLDRVRNVPEPDLAESCEPSDDGLIYECRILADAVFHNGRSITASDFKRSWERLLDPANPSPKAWYFDLVEGVEAYRAGITENVSGIEAEDPGLIRIRLRQPFAPFLYHLAHPGTSVVPPEEVEHLGDAFGPRPVGSGPYRFVSWKDDRVTLEAFDGHSRHRPHVKKLVYEIIPDSNEALRRYQEGDLDLLSTLPAGSLHSIRQTFGADLRIFPGSAWFGFCFRCDRKPFDDRRVRQAFSLALDREALVRELGDQYIAAIGFLPQSIPGHDSATLTSGYAPDRARRLLAAAGYPGDTFPQIYLTGRDGGAQEVEASFLKAAYSEVGLDVGVETIEFNALIAAQRAGELPFFRLGWGVEYPDPDPYFRPLFHSRGTDNTTGYRNPVVDALLDDARQEQNDARRQFLYSQAEQLIQRDAPCVVLYHRTEAILLRPKWRNVPIGYNPAHLEIERAKLARGDE